MTHDLETTDTKSGIVQCPICGQNVLSSEINVHIDNNCPPLPVVETPAATGAQSSSETSVDIPKPINDTRIAPLFAPKAGSQGSSESSVDIPKSIRDTRMAPLFAPRQAARPPPSSPLFGTNSSQKRTVETQPTPSAKRKKTDAVSDSMPLAAKGKLIKECL